MTHLEDVQQAFTRVCFDLVPREEDLAALRDDRDRWLMYRRMVRHRLFEMARSGLPKSAELLGKPRFDGLIASYLAEHGPTTRYIREVVLELLAHAEPILAADDSLPAHALELLRYEAAKWEVGAAEWPETDAAELDFDAVAVFNPTLRTVEVRHRVDKDPVAPPTLDDPHLLLVYRKPHGRLIFTYVLNPMGARLFRAWRTAQSCSDGAREVLAATNREPDPGFVDSMATVLATLIEEHVVLGSVRT